MKKNDILKTLFILVLITIGLTWFIGVGSYQNGEFSAQSTVPLGFLDIIRLPFTTFSNFIHYGIIVLLVGAFYGVFNKTGIYSSIVGKITTKNSKGFLIFTMILFILLASLVGGDFLLFILVPFFVTILLAFSYDKITALAATIGAILVGNLGATYNHVINATSKYYFGVSIHNEILTKVIFLFIISFLFVLFVLKFADKKSKQESKKGEIPLYIKENKSNKNKFPFVFVAVLSFLFLAIATFNWYISFGTEVFYELHDSFKNITVNGYPLFSNIIGSSNVIGNWGIYDFSIILVILILLVSWLYSLKKEEIIDGILNGIKATWKPAVYVVLANIVLVAINMNQGSGTNILYTIGDFVINLSTNFSIVTMSLVSLIGTFFLPDFINYSSIISTITLSSFNNEIFYPIMPFITQFVHGIMMFILPTSMLLVAGLGYLNISLKEWLSYIWKYLLIITFISIIVLIIINIFL